MKATLQRLARRYSRKYESGTEYDGFLSYAGEFHALGSALAVGAASAIYQQPEIAATFIMVAVGMKPGQMLGGKVRTLSRRMRGVGKASEASTLDGELRREPWYACGGVLIGYAAGAVVEIGPGAEQAALDLAGQVLTAFL